MTNPTNKKTESVKLSDNERIKGSSDYLRGTIANDLGDGLTGGFTKDNFQLIRFHGMYEQDDRDIRAERKQQKLEPFRNMMLRCRLPGGIIQPKQWLAIDSFASEHTHYGSIRITNRQTFQFHGVQKRDLRTMHQLLHSLGLDSIATAGDVNRNVLCTSNPIESRLHQQAYHWASKISEHLLPKTRAYLEIWIDGKKQQSSETKFEDSEPILGKTYLPRKFKTAVIVPPHNDVDAHANDLIFIAVSKDDELIGFNVLVGGGLSMEHGNKKTYPNIAREFGYIPLKATLATAEAIVTTQRDLGNRSDRKNAKTRYTLERVGTEFFIAEVEKRMQSKFEPIRPYQLTSRGDRIGWVQGFDERWHLTLFIASGRLLDHPDRALKTGVREIAKIHTGDFRLTANQNLIIANVKQTDKAKIEKIARQHGLISDQLTPLQENAMACVSFPTCPLAMAEAERFLPSFLNKIEQILINNQLANEHIVLRVTGCPNGCARAMLAEVGLVGKAIGRYNLYLGGNRAGTRIPRLFKENITEDEILQILTLYIEKWAKQRTNDEEGFGDFLVRGGVVQPVVNAAIDFHDDSLVASSLKAVAVKNKKSVCNV